MRLYGIIGTRLVKRCVPMANEQQRHDISDKVWEVLEPHLPDSHGRGVVLPMIIGSLLTEFSGFYAQELRGETYT